MAVDGRSRAQTGSRPAAKGPSGGLRTRGLGVVLIGAAGLAAVCCYLLIAVLLPHRLTEYKEYGKATACPATAPVHRWEDCIRTVTFTVQHTTVRPKSHRATLSGTPYWNGVVDFGDPGPVLDELHSGDRVKGTVWRGRVMHLIRSGEQQATSDEPRDEPQWFAGLATSTALLGAMCLWFGLVRLVRPRAVGLCTWDPVGQWLLGIALVAGFGWGLVAAWFGLPWQSVPPVVTALSVAGLWVLIDRRRRSLRGRRA